MAKSAGVLHSTIEISDNILIQESTYSYIDGIDTKRPNEKTGVSKRGWRWLGSTEESKKVINGALWIVRDIYIKNSKKYKLPK